MINPDKILHLLVKYHDELTILSSKLNQCFLSMRNKGQGACFSDFEGEVIYCLLREYRPEVVYEISPDCGYSTNYLLAAIQTNNQGKLYSFEIETSKFGTPTKNIILDNLIVLPDASEFELVMGDASKMVPKFPDPDFVLIDSCHETWFADWYVQDLFPRIKMAALVQDIHFWDRPEYSSESLFLMDNLNSWKKSFFCLGVVERLSKIEAARQDFMPRYPYETNSILIGFQLEVDFLLPLQEDPLDNMNFDLAMNDTELSKKYHHISGLPKRPNRHRGYLNLAKIFALRSNKLEAARCFQMALGEAIAIVSVDNGKGLRETALFIAKNGMYGRLVRVLYVILSCSPIIFAKTVYTLISCLLSISYASLRSRIRCLVRIIRGVR